MSIDKQNNKQKVQLTFGGCGGMYNYSLGVASVIQSNFSLDNVVFAGSSAGCFPAMLLALDLNIDELFESWNIPFLKEINSTWLGAVSNWNIIARKWSVRKLPEKAYKRLDGRFFVSHTNVDFHLRGARLSNSLVGNWENNSDLLDGLMASSFVPLFDIGKVTGIFRGKRIIDGAITNSWPLPLGKDVPSLIIKRDMWRDNNNSWLWPWTQEDWVREVVCVGKRRCVGES